MTPCREQWLKQQSVSLSASQSVLCHSVSYNANLAIIHMVVMLKFISWKTKINSERDIVIPILNNLICKVTVILSTTPVSMKIARQNGNLNWEEKYPWLLYQKGCFRKNWCRCNNSMMKRHITSGKVCPYAEIFSTGCMYVCPPVYVYLKPWSHECHTYVLLCAVYYASLL